MSTLEWLEALSYVVTIVGLPLAIVVFIMEQRKERQNDDEEVYLKLSDSYTKFLQLCLQHADLGLMSRDRTPADLSPEQIERRNILFEILVSLFEQAYLLVYEVDMGTQTARLWQTWEDYMRAWCLRADFRELLPALLEGEDPDFCRHILAISREEAGKQPGKV